MTRGRFLAVVLVVMSAIPVAGLAQTEAALTRAVEALLVWQQADGGFTNGFSEGSDVSTTADAVLAAVAAGIDPRDWGGGGSSPLDYLAEQAASGAISTPGQAAKVAIAATVAGMDAGDFGGVNLTAQVLAGFDEASGFFGGGPFDTALAVIALTAADQPLPDQAIRGLLDSRLEDGSYSFSGDPTPGSGDSNTTAMVVQALLAAGEQDAIEPSLAYFRAVQNEDGGWTYQKPSPFGEETDANSTALVLQALMAAGEDPGEWGHPEQALLALQVSSGAFIFNASTSAENVLATVQAIPVLAGMTYAQVAEQGSALAPAGGPSGEGRGRTAAIVLGLVGAVLIGAALIAWRRGSPEPGV